MDRVWEIMNSTPGTGIVKELFCYWAWFYLVNSRLIAVFITIPSPS